MKKLLLILLCLPLLSYAQHSDRVLEIKKMYKKTRSYEKKGDCKTISWEEIDEDDEYGRSFEREVTKCIYPDNYSRISLSFSLWESWLDGEYYFKNGNLYFAYLFDDWGNSIDKWRIYFKENGEVEKILVDYGDGNTKVNDRGEIEIIEQNEIRWLNIALKELNKRK
jgi:hypothetical protein